MLKIQGLRKCYKQSQGEFIALDNINITFPETGLVALYGENGCGKTTLLNAISTVDIDYEGDILLDNDDIKKSLSTYRRNVVSYVFQENEFVDYLNIGDNLLLFSENESEDEVLECLKEYDIQEKFKEYASCLSGGQRQRASLIRGCMKRSRILLVDEPTSNLNEEMESFVFEILKKMAREKLVIFVTHNKTKIQEYADYIIKMDKAHIVDMQKNNVEKVEYTEDGVNIPNSRYKLSLLDHLRVQSILEKSGKLIIKVKEIKQEGERQKTLEMKKEYRPNKEMSMGFIRRLVINSLMYSKGYILSMLFLIGFFVTLLCSLVSFSKYDKNRFIYESIINNVDGFITFERNYDVSSHNEKYDLMTKEGIDEMIQYYDSDIIVLEQLEYPMELDFETYGFYVSYLYGLALCEKDNLLLAEGKISIGNQYMITDYIADALISVSEEYSNYNDVIKNGISIMGHIVEVSGIIDTDYERYKSKYNEEFTLTQEYVDFQQNVWNQYARIYQSYEQYYEDKGGIIERYENQDYIVGIEEDDNLIESAGCIINKIFAEECDVTIGQEIYLSTGYYAVEDIVDDGDECAKVYVSADVLQWMKDNKLQDTELIMIRIANKDEVAYLYEHRMKAGTSIGLYIEDTLDIIGVLQNLFIGLAISLGIILLILIFTLVKKLIQRDRYLISMMVMSGYSGETFNKIAIIKFGIVSILVMIVNGLMTILSNIILNSGLSMACGMNIRILQIGMSVVIINMLIGVFITIIGLVMVHAMRYENVIKCKGERI